jgi:two-component system sensor histidine kinase ArlS
LLVDLIFTRLLLRPLGIIIRTKLLNRKFPFKENLPPVKTSTKDFRFLDDSLIDLMSKIREAFEKEREFTSNASHELMTPISILQNKMENLLDNDLPEALQEKVMTMMHTLGRLKKIVRSLLLISRIENDQFEKSTAVNIGLLVEEVIKELEDRFEARGINVQLDVSKDAIIKSVNRDLLFQLVYNLVNNAIRYNKENGEVHISGQYSPDATYTLEIKDSGIGIPQKDLAGIFDRFKKSASTGEESHGLGLSIVKSIALYHHWQIKVTSEPGKWTIFSIVF